MTTTIHPTAETLQTISFNRTSWEGILDQILCATAADIGEVGYEEYWQSANERFFHHQFSRLLWKHFHEQGVDMWAEHLLTPEGKTEGEFKWRSVCLKDVQRTKAEALIGKRGNHDFVIKTKPRVRVEWKGPKMFSVKEVAEVCLKLLHRVPDDEPKLVCAILTPKRGSKKHVETLRQRFMDELKFACDVVGCKDIASRNLFVYVATILDGKPLKCHWGQLADIDVEWEPIKPQESKIRTRSQGAVSLTLEMNATKM